MRGTLLGLCWWQRGSSAFPRWCLGRTSHRQLRPRYRDVPYVGSRNVIWVIAQLHLLLAGFVLGVPIFAWVCEVVAWKGGEKRYDKLAKEFTKLLTSAYATTALFGGILLFLLISFYPKLMNYLTDIFFPSFILYCLLFLVETATLYLYWYGWDAMQDRRQEDISYFPRFHAELLCVLHHDRAELLGHVPGQSRRDRRGDGYGAGLGRDMESDLVAGEHSPPDCERGARRLYLRRVRRDSLSVRQELRKSATTTTGWAMSGISSASSVCWRSRLPATGSCVKFTSTTSRWASR